MATVLVTGATGFLGREVTRQLLARGDDVVALVRDPARAEATLAGILPGPAGRALPLAGIAPPPATGRLRLADGTVTDASAVRTALAGADAVMHIAGWYALPRGKPRPGYETNVTGTRVVLEAMRDLAIPRGVYTSSLVVNSDTHGALVQENYQYTGGRFLSWYEETKYRAHYEVAEPLIAAGLPLVILQPGVIYGPGDTSVVHQALDDFLTGRLPGLPARAAVCWSYVEDQARAHLLALDRGVPGQNYFAAGPPHTFTDAVAVVARLTERRPPRTLPVGLVKMAAGLLGLAEAVGLGPGAASWRSIAGVTYIADDSRARRDLGWSPRPLAEGLVPTLRWELDRLGLPLPAPLRT